jgi:hypothetical protein
MMSSSGAGAAKRHFSGSNSSLQNSGNILNKKQ